MNHESARRIPGSGFFRAGAIGLVVFGAVHTLAIYQANFGVPTDPGELELHRMSRALRQHMGPFEFTAYGLIQILNSSYSALLLFAGTLNLVALGPVAAAGRLRALTMVNVTFVLLLGAICLIYRFPPPLAFALVILILFIVSLIRQSGDTKSRD